MYYKFFAFALSLSILAGACIPANVYEKNYSFKSHNWSNKTTPNFSFNISDTTSNYAVYIYLRHTDAYPYSNIWINISTKMPNGALTVQKVELNLAEKKGKWLGRGMDEIVEHKISLNSNGSTRFNQIGIHTLQLQQIMRENPLPEILSIGVGLEKLSSQ